MSRFTRFAALAAVAAAVLVPAGQAMTLISDNAPSQNTSGQSPYVHSAGQSPDAYLAGLGVVQQAEPVSFTTENAPSQNRISLLNAAENGAIGSPASSFDWGDAGIGAGVAGCLVLLLAGGMFTVRRGGAQRVAL